MKTSSNSVVCWTLPMSRVVTISAADVCKKIPAKYEDIVEFCCLLDAANVKRALIDSSRVVTISAADVCKKIPAKYEDIVEFCCLLDAANVKVGDSVKITLKSKTADGYNVQIDNSGTQSEGKVSRWVPLVEVAQPATKPVTGPVEVQVPRPEVRHKSTVLLVEAPAMDRVLVRPADTESVRRFDAVLQDVAQYGFHATPINEPPQKGQMVIGKFSDGLCYRALCIRTNVKANKFMLEYVEFGNVAISPRESIYACPQQWDLSAAPTVVSVVKLGAEYALTGDAALEYIESVREAEFLLTLANGAASAPSGAEVHLALSKNGESVNQKLLMMCKPDWKKIEESGGDVLDVRPIMLSDLEYVSLPTGGCEVEVLDVSMLASGALSGCERAPGRSVCDAIEPVSKQVMCADVM
ncbi:uncharacterized protein LOC112057225 [Bicyclus anynana]|uniref:Uncharacterized protein LOC112057225 n=1 Tax=Bicyclus anynana TaxID=110368 RepID=A0ABM3M4S9_BICAN|nr:uncharacterized protein LOC112057225 [Bicyclus anynana]